MEMEKRKEKATQLNLRCSHIMHLFRFILERARNMFHYGDNCSSSISSRSSHLTPERRNISIVIRMQFKNDFDDRAELLFRSDQTETNEEIMESDRDGKMTKMCAI